MVSGATVLGFWDRANATVRIALLAFALLVGVTIFNRFSGKPADVADIHASGGVYQAPEVVKDTPRKDLPVPQGKKPEDYQGRLDITVKDKYIVTKLDTPGTVITTTKEVTVLIPKDESVPPISPNDPSISATYSQISTPFLQVGTDIVGGVGVDEGLRPTPFLGVSLVQVFKNVELGAGLNRGGVGPFAGYEFWREFAFFGQYNLLKFGTNNSQVAVGISYRF